MKQHSCEVAELMLHALPDDTTSEVVVKYLIIDM
jgi:hypothetical protein